MKEHPILFRPEMVKAILEDRKTQTRRPVNLPANAKHVAYWSTPTGRSQLGYADPGVNYWTTRGNHIDACPFGQPGDRLWVKERHCYLDVAKELRRDFKGARAEWDLVVEYSDGTEMCRRAVDLQPGPRPDLPRPKQTRERGEIGWRPAIFMNRWASRLSLEVTRIRVERLQEISEADVIAEGIRPREWAMENAVRYSQLWDSMRIGTSVEWVKNPWVWVIEFRRWP